ncbi:hypothetical protein BMI90_11295 [Thioclava sp. L04-15]|uniref:tyrosine-protein phosphatase n=1 Tax=Thioclava sp. L04-15 TaxID=1915318 RepID=UPI000996E166|nr:tyrosine-protein phosphatase [Thioclava sp. L04-15]OOY27785.1 hypothetical protein BMI90_11295 [Thioclava sp. L04-15]
MTFLKFGRIVGTVVFGILAALVLYLCYLQLSGNFHTVVAGEFYRSNQPTATRLKTYKEKDRIQSVLNLRGAHPGEAWYDEEKAAAERLGLKLIDFKMSDSEVLGPARVAELEAVMAKAPKPMLVHCKAGADRTGLASALYLSHQKNRSSSEAGWQLSLLYGHIGVPLLSRAWPMDETWMAVSAVQPFSTAGLKAS